MTASDRSEVLVEERKVVDHELRNDADQVGRGANHDVDEAGLNRRLHLGLAAEHAVAERFDLDAPAGLFFHQPSRIGAKPVRPGGLP
jgi:hypothetical protein